MALIYFMLSVRYMVIESIHSKQKMISIEHRKRSMMQHKFEHHKYACRKFNRGKINDVLLIIPKNGSSLSPFTVIGISNHINSFVAKILC